jgi:DNA-directed RNA polymerase specialized sigma24 family protein
VANNYCDKARLCELVELFQTTGAFTDELVTIINEITSGLYLRYHFGASGLELKDYQQDCLAVLCEKMHKIDIKGNPFSWITTVVFNHYRAIWRKDKAEKGKLQTVRNNLLKSLPGRIARGENLPVEREIDRA